MNWKCAYLRLPFKKIPRRRVNPEQSKENQSPNDPIFYEATEE
jgi:hypothetical protein